ncbi:MAG: CHAT domain-containing protein [Acidobacteriota bacterium]
MSNRTVVSVEPRGDDTIEVKLAKAPIMIAGARIPQMFDCDPDLMPAWTEQGAVQTHGRAIFDKLGTHAAIKQAFTVLLGIKAPQIRSLYFHLVADEAERLSWETLCDPTGTFLALDRRWPIARMADSEVDQGVPHGDFVPPLKVMAVLSAIHRPAKLEWEGLRDAVRDTRAKGLAVELIVMVGEEALLDTIRKQAAADAMNWLTVMPIPDRIASLDAALAEHQPHILHFYSHGSASSGVSQLHLATIPDWDDDDRTTGSLILTLDELSNFPALVNAWLVTLNCCEGGKAANDLHSMAHRLVAGGVPAAIGMIEPINAGDAHEFAGVFYPALLASLRMALAQAQATGNRVEFEWAPALHLPRTALRDRHGGDAVADRAWTLPVLYVRPEPFELRYLDQAVVATPPGVQPPPAPVVLDPAAKERIEVVAGFLRALPPDTPLDARVALLAILNDVPTEFRPALDGTISGDVSV